MSRMKMKGGKLFKPDRIKGSYYGNKDTVVEDAPVKDAPVQDARDDIEGGWANIRSEMDVELKMRRKHPRNRKMQCHFET